MKKKVLLTVNPGLLDGRRFSTIRSLVTRLDRLTELVVTTMSEYDFVSGRVRAYKRSPGGGFEKRGMVTPQCDLWLVYTDGYWLNARDYGFARRADFLSAQFDLHRYHLDIGNVMTMINTPDVEMRTLKSWFSALAADDENLSRAIIPTHKLANVGALLNLRRERGILVAKPDWGGGMSGVFRLDSDADLNTFQCYLNAQAPYMTMSDYCFQDYLPAQCEKRFWIAGGEIVGARIVAGRHTPWHDAAGETAHIYDAGFKSTVDDYERDVKFVRAMVAKSGLNVGSVDFIGDYINEINGCGTVFTHYNGRNKLIDLRERLLQSVCRQLTSI